METELKVPAIGESITEVEIGDWLKKEGDSVNKDENVVVLETDKATVDFPAPVAGKINRILKKKGETAKIGEVIGYVEDSKAADKPKAEIKAEPKGEPKAESKQETKTEPKPETAPKPETPPARVMPAAARLLAENNIPAETVIATGPGGRILKEDVLAKIQTDSARTQEKPSVAPAAAPTASPAAPPPSDRPEEVVPMSKLRRTLAERLVQVQNTAALLTTFNEVDMSATMSLRKEYQEAFVERYGAKLGFMSFFVKACIDALKLVPQVNAEIRDNNIVYHNYYDIGVAVGGGKGLVVPILRNADRLSFSQLEIAINDFGKRAKEGKLKVDELHGGTFTISNGGVYGSLLSTPIINPPQSGILGMHAIQERPVAREGAVVIRPMMYVALTYDHRIVDGREAVMFLKRIKDVIENPSRMLLEI